MGLCSKEKALKKEIDELEEKLRHAEINVDEKDKDAQYLQVKLQKVEAELRQANKETENVKRLYDQLKREHEQLIDQKQELINKLKKTEIIKVSEDDTTQRTPPPQPANLKRRQGVKPSIEDQLAPKVSVKVIEKPKATAQQLRSALKSCDMLRTLPEANVETMVNSMEREAFDPVKPIIIKEGDKGEHLYIILTGAVEVDLNTGPKVIHAPYVFGEIALIYNTPRTCTIRGRDKCQLWSLRRAVFDAIMRDQDDHIDR